MSKGIAGRYVKIVADHTNLVFGVLGTYRLLDRFLTFFLFFILRRMDGEK